VSTRDGALGARVERPSMAASAGDETGRAQNPFGSLAAAGAAQALPARRGRRVFFVNRYFHPDHSATSMLLGDLAFALSRSGEYAVTVITSRQRYDDPTTRLPSQETMIGVDIRRLAGTHFGRGRLIGRSVDYLSFHASAAWAVFRLIRRGDVVVTKTDPPLLSLTVGLVAGMLGAYRVNWLQDLFPEIATALGVRGFPRPAFAALTAVRDLTLRSADANVVIGDLMAQRLRDRDVPERRIQVIPNWVDSAWFRPVSPSANRKRAAWGLEQAFVVQYSGNFGRAHGFDTILSAIEQLRDRAPRIRFLFVGGGANRATIEQLSEEYRLTNVQFKPYQPRSDLAETLSVADVHLVTLLPSLEGLVVPSKFYGICAVGRPTIYIGDLDGEIARIIRRENTGVTVRHDDASGLVEALMHLATDCEYTAQLGRNARALAETECDKLLAIAKFENLLNGLAQSTQ
jgi:colanic acid biosynthesis glycosyl transferase WcaI